MRYYNTGSGTARYNGNISSMTWKAAAESTLRGYKFTYDGLDRLSNAIYGEGTTIAGTNRFGETPTYDKHGNITQFVRMNNGTSATLAMQYAGNQLTRKGTSAYAYDANGNMTVDNSKNISNIQYNILNLPERVQFSSAGVASYVYDAAGVKRQVKHQGAGVSQTTDYCGNVIYENGALSKILTEEGYITLSGTTPTYHYYLKDHLGNNRVVLNQDGTTVEQVSHYYPFGGVFDQTAETTQPYKFGGKELDRTYGLDLYDYSARYMDGAIGRFTTMDPLAEKYYAISPYAYCAGNPVRYVDLRGDSITIMNGKQALTYNSGNLYNADGSAYMGKVKGYLKSAMGALGSLNATTEGAALVSELQNSINMFTIKNGSNKFKPISSNRAGANLAEVQAVTGNMVGSSGSGGTIYWNANSTSGGLDLAGGTSRPAYIGLGHEMGHASDSNQGLLHYGSMDRNGNVAPNSYVNIVTGFTYNYTYNGLLKSEWRAVYRENIIRGQAGISLRIHYGINMSTGVPVGLGPRLLTPANIPINYP